MNGKVAADQTDRQRDVTCDNSPKESEEAGKTRYQEQLVDNEVERRKVCTRAKERLVVKATGNTGTLSDRAYDRWRCQNRRSTLQLLESAARSDRQQKKVSKGAGIRRQRGE